MLFLSRNVPPRDRHVLAPPFPTRRASGLRNTFKAVHPGAAIFDGASCEGKAAFVLRGESATVDGLVFRNMAVDDGNGAGIRTEMGDLTVRNAMFVDSQEGILGGEPTGQRIVIDRSTFRSEERRGGKECGSTCRSRGSPDQ